MTGWQGPGPEPPQAPGSRAPGWVWAVVLWAASASPVTRVRSRCHGSPPRSQPTVGAHGPRSVWSSPAAGPNIGVALEPGVPWDSEAEKAVCEQSVHMLSFELPKTAPARAHCPPPCALAQANAPLRTRPGRGARHCNQAQCAPVAPGGGRCKATGAERPTLSPGLRSTALRMGGQCQLPAPGGTGPGRWRPSGPSPRQKYFRWSISSM